MPAHASLVISLYRRDAGGAGTRPGYGLELQFAAAGSETEKIASGPTPLAGDDPRFLELGPNPAAYGAHLAGQLLAEPSLRTFFDQALAASQAENAGLHIRLHIRPDAAELHNLRWETLRLPEAAEPLLAGENVTFSRYLASRDWRPVRPRSAADIRALVAVADPSDAAAFGLAPVNRELELAAARAGLDDLPAAELAARGQVTLEEIVARLREGCDILYLVAHGRLVDGEPWLFLERPDGATRRISGRELAARIQELDDRPRLAVLVSCQSAGQGQEPVAQDRGALAAVGPRLAEAGVPAVIAMQGNFTMKTAAAFMPVLLRELRRDGLVDRSVAVARGSVRDRPDWWMPILFTALTSGRVWEPANPDALPRMGTQPFEPETVYVPAGRFLMGHAEGSAAPAWELPQQVCTLPGFRIGRHPVTNAQYLAFVRERRMAVAPEAGWTLVQVGQEPPPGRADHPMVGVTWDDAVAYCRWLGDKTGRRYRLPTEAEWEKAASWAAGREPGSTEAALGGRKRRYPWGDTFDATKCNSAETGIGATTAVGAYSARGGDSPCGVADMAGNVSEWTNTRWGIERSQPQYNPLYDPDDGREDPARDEPFREVRIVRGGSYGDAADRVTCTARGRDKADSRHPRRGFRVAMELTERAAG